MEIDSLDDPIGPSPPDVTNFENGYRQLPSSPPRPEKMPGLSSGITSGVHPFEVGTRHTVGFYLRSLPGWRRLIGGSKSRTKAYEMAWRPQRPRLECSESIATLLRLARGQPTPRGTHATSEMNETLRPPGGSWQELLPLR